MDVQSALQQLETVLDEFERSLYDGEVIDPVALMDACQMFRSTGQNFDDRNGAPIPETLVRPPSGAALPAGLERAMLEALAERLARVISAVEMSQESIEAELDGITNGRRALRGYQSILPIAEGQYVTVSR